MELADKVGNPLLYLGDEGKPNDFWEKHYLTYIALPRPLALSWNPKIKVMRVKCNGAIARFLKLALDEILLDPEVGPTINDYGGCYEFRTIRKARTVLSRHSFGTAIDLDVCDNPYGKIPNVHPKTIEVFNKHGFLWGGTFKGARKDGMHFEFADLGRL